MSRFNQPAEPAPPDRRRCNMFVASFYSECYTCFDDIDEGDDAGYIPGDPEASCASCCADYENERG